MKANHSGVWQNVDINIIFNYDQRFATSPKVQRLQIEENVRSMHRESYHYNRTQNFWELEGAQFYWLIVCSPTLLTSCLHYVLKIIFRMNVYRKTHHIFHNG